MKKHFDLFVIGGGSGGLASSKAAARLSKRVGLADFVRPSAHGSSWGLGGTCVNVGCVPKKLMHFASQLGELRRDQANAGWQGTHGGHDWGSMVAAVGKYVRRLNGLHQQFLEGTGVHYYNQHARLLDRNTIILGGGTLVTADKIIVATGARPLVPAHYGKKVITSDDLFSLPEPPGKTLVVGGSYVGLECAGFLNGFGVDVTVMVRDKLLSRLDQEMARKVGAYMERKGVKFIKGESPEVGERRGKKVVGGVEYDTVVLAIGREAEVRGMGLEEAGVEVRRKVVCDEQDQTTAENIYAVGDCVEDRQELTPLAIMCGRKLVKRLYQGSSELMDYALVPTAVFTPLEYAVVGLSEQAAVRAVGSDHLQVFRGKFKPLIWNFNPDSDPDACLVKMLVHKPTQKVLGLHYLGPEAAEVIQGFAVALKMGATKKHFDDTVGIHPSAAEEIVQLT